MTIDEKYVLFTRIHLVKSKNGEFFCDVLWAKDLIMHLNYLSDLRLCCPVILSDETDGLINISNVGINEIYELKKDYGLLTVLKNILPNFIAVVNAAKNADIVHSGGAGWAFPLSFYLLFCKPFFSFKWVMLIESSFWMKSKGDNFSIRGYFEHYCFKYLLKICVRNADARIFTQSFYRKLFLDDDISRTLINPASWVDESKILCSDFVTQRFENRAKTPTLNVIYPARLIKDKGVYILFEAISLLSKMKVPVNISIMGTGQLVRECKEFVLKDFGTVVVKFRDPVDYGNDFFNVISEYDYVLVPNIKDEQPRIIFDAFSQGVAVIASDTPGIVEITSDKDNAIIFKSADAMSFASAIRYAVKNQGLISVMGLNGLDYVKNKTHMNMHFVRRDFLIKTLKL